MNVEKLKDVSIIGRLAYANLCLENAFEKEVLLRERTIIFLLETIWEFVSSDNLSLWHEKVEKLNPEYLLNCTYSSVDGLIEEKDFIYLTKVYSSSASYLTKMIEGTIWVGVSNLYGGTGDFSKTSFEAVSSVIQLSLDNNVQIPSIENVSFSRFSESNGWGDKVLSLVAFGSKLPSILARKV